MKIAETSIARPVLTSMSILSLVVFGAASYGFLGVDLFPDVDFPIVTVTVVYEGANPETVESEVTDPIEEAVNTISGVKTLRSESTEGLAQVFIEFELEEDIDVVSQEVRDKVAAIRGDLPLTIESPLIEKFDPDSSPIMSIVLAAPVSVGALSDLADNTIKPQLDNISGVGNVRLVGDREREVRIWLRPDDLRRRSISSQDVIDALRKENLEPPGGRIETDRREVVVKTRGKVERVEDFEDLIIANRGGVPIRLHEVAHVEDGMEDFRSLARLNGRRAVSLQVRRQSGSNSLAVAGAVKDKLAEIRENLPKGYELIIAQDLSRFIAESFQEAQSELLRGGCLAVIVILFFLRSFSGSFVAAVTIPATIISTFTFMYVMGFTLNMMSMLALTISVGMIIDDTIVVLENSYRHMEEGKPRKEAAHLAIAEIGFAVVATSLAIAAVFVPVAFMTGLVGKFFYEFGLTVTFAVAVSTFLAVTLSPMLCSRVLVVKKQHGRIFNGLETFFKILEAGYSRMLNAALRFRVLVILAAIGVFVGGMAIAPFLGNEFVPVQDEDQFMVQVETPIGSSIHETGRTLAEIERRMAELPGVTDVFTTLGAGVEGRVNVGSVQVNLVSKFDRSRSQMEIMEIARRQLSNLPHLKLSVEAIPRVSGGGWRNAPVQYNLRGSNMADIVSTADKMEARMTELDGLVDVASTYDAGKPEASLLIDREKISEQDVSVEELGGAVRALIGGQMVSTFEDKERGENYDVRVRLMQSGRDRPDSIASVPVRTRTGELLELRNFVQVDEATGPVQIDRQDRMRQITLMANLQPHKTLGAALTDVEQAASEVGLPSGVSAQFTGDGELMGESFASIYFSLALAVILIYMVLASQFESLIHPFTVMLSLPLSIVGALGALWITDRTLNIFSMIGMIMLMGLVTKNAILLVDYTNTLRRRGMSKDDALRKAGPVRLRPILMTACSTMAGMFFVSLGLGAGAETRAPMGTAIVGGMVTSTLLTLIVIPVVYSVMDDLGCLAKRVVGLGGSAGIRETPFEKVEKESTPVEDFVPVELGDEDEPILLETKKEDDQRRDLDEEPAGVT
jgi:HAE1 family hydrophobic/amphiphilic exporter-1